MSSGYQNTNVIIKSKDIFSLESSYDLSKGE